MSFDPSKITPRTKKEPIKGEDGIVRKPAAWSSYYWIMLYTNLKAEESGDGYENLIWNRYFCRDLSQEQKEKLGIPNIKPLNQKERDALQDFVETNLQKQYVPGSLPPPFDTPDLSKTYWSDDMEAYCEELIFPTGINFSGAQFSQSEAIYFADAKFFGESDVNFSKVQLLSKGGADFSGAQFFIKGGVDFSGTEFSGEYGVSFCAAQFCVKGDISFTLTTFGKGGADFSKARFFGKGDVSFSLARFFGPGDVSFSGTKFSGQGVTNFSRVRFLGEGEVTFFETKFLKKGGTTFSGAEFLCEKGTDFSDVRFSSKGDISFSLGNFSGKGGTSFVGAVFQGEGILNFSRVKFLGEKGVNFDWAQFSCEGGTNFFNVKFAGYNAGFYHITARNILSFASTRFESKFFLTDADLEKASLVFSGADFAKGMNLDHVRYPVKAVPYIDPSIIKQYEGVRDEVTFLAHPAEVVETAWRVMRNAVKGEDARQIELELFGRELEARAARSDISIWEKLLIKAYGFLSNYGRSLKRPLVAWFAIVIIFGVLYHVFSYAAGTSHPNLLTSFFFSLQESAHFLSVSDTVNYKQITETLFCAGDGNACGLVRHYVYPVLRMIQKLCSLLFVILFGVGVRNSLRLH